MSPDDLELLFDHLVDDAHAAVVTRAALDELLTRVGTATSDYLARVEPNYTRDSAEGIGVENL